MPKKMSKPSTVGQNETITVNKQALMDAVLDWERRSAIQHYLLERSLGQMEATIRQCRDVLSGCGVVQAKGGLLGLFSSNTEWERCLHLGLMGEDDDRFP